MGLGEREKMEVGGHVFTETEPFSPDLNSIREHRI